MKLITAKILFCLASICSTQATCYAQADTRATTQATDNIFHLNKPDYQKSPYTGMTRRHWIEAGEYLLGGAFSYIHCLDDPMYFPKQLDKTYPKDEKAAKVAKLEGLARTLFVAAPLLRDNPDLTLNGIKVADYYRHQLVSISDPESKHYIAHRTGGPSQTLLELGSLAISLKGAQKVLWDPLSQQEKDDLAATMKSYGEGPSIGSNWMFFNCFILSFLKDQGYQVDETKLTDWLNKLLDRYRGEGWYNDAPAYDYYSMWAYQSYGPLWAELFGKKQYPDIAKRFINNEQDLIGNYPYMFARDGQMNMWGRSICYRFAAVTPLPLVEYAGFKNVNYGWLRHIASASLLQFMQNPEFLENGVPTMGFYGPFAPCVQIYSCRGSVYWIGKAFLGLLLPESSQYWSATENEGPWKDELKKGHVHNKFQPATNLLITNYPNSGASEMRSWCHESVANDWQKFRSSENYNKLSYSTAFPWMADGEHGEISMNYGTKNKNGEWEVLRLYDFKSFENGIYQRHAVLETDKETTYELSEIPLPDGILRIDRVSVSSPTDICLGHYSLANPKTHANDTTAFTRPALPAHALDKKAATHSAIIDNGEYSLALIPIAGWTEEAKVIYPKGLHPVSMRCALPILNEHVDKEKVLVTLMLWKKTKGDKQLTAKELSVVKSCKINQQKDKTIVTVKLNTGETKTVTF